MTTPPVVLFEDEDLLVIDKPVGVVVHPTYKNFEGTLLDLLAPGCSIVTRLDKLTSGAVVVAKRSDAHARLQRALARSDAEKRYVALVHGECHDCGAIDLPLGADPADRRRRAVIDSGRECRTEFERVALSRGPAGVVSLVQCRLRTGRRHQIRVHLAAAGWAILGDPMYGTGNDAGRLALHAAVVSFIHPRSQLRLRVEAPLPPDFERLLDEHRVTCVLPGACGPANAGSMKR
jgi:23S rRNA pseudouridine1911/1915/1917 synthase